MFGRNLSLLIGLLSIAFLKANSQDYIVSEISFSGTDRIKESFLFKNIHTEVGDTLSKEKLKKDILSLTFLPPVAKTTYKLDTINNSHVSIEYVIEDAITFIPGFSFGNRGENLWFGAGVKTLNLFKCGQQVALEYFRVDQEHNLDLFYRIPYLGNTKWTLGASAYRRGSLEPLFFQSGSFDYRYSIKNFSVSPGYRFSPRHSLELATNFFKETYDLESDNLMGLPAIPEFKVDRKYLFEISHKINNIKYDYFLLNGTSNRFSIQWVKTISESYHFFSLTDEFKKYWQLGRGTNFAIRLKASLATNSKSPFAPFVLDNDANIRGVGSRVFRGTGEVLTNVELRQNVFSFGRFAGQVVAFSDIGSWRSPGGEYKDFIDSELLKIHVGLGVRAIYTRGHNYILRADYGVDAVNGFKGTNGFVIGVGQYF